MKFSLSTNWCNRRMESGEEIADKAMELGFEGLELGFHTTMQQVKGFRARLDVMPVGSVHAFCPVPISAPEGYPELYQLASFDDEMRAMARIHVKRNVEFAASMGAGAVVLHAGRVMCRGFLKSRELKRREKRGKKMVDVFRKELEQVVPVLEKNKVTLGLENLPYLEGFPSEDELKGLVGEWVKPWFDTGHDYVRQQKGWTSSSLIPHPSSPIPHPSSLIPIGLHINDSNGGDDHLPPGEGKIDFTALKPLAETARHLVFEPHQGVTEEALKKGLAHIRTLWGGGEGEGHQSTDEK